MENTLTTLNGLFKEVWSKELKEVVPDHVKFYNMVPFASKEATGRKYHQGVVLG